MEIFVLHLKYPKNKPQTHASIQEFSLNRRGIFTLYIRYELTGKSKIITCVL